MPIRLCQKCGLKVLIDESQAGTNPFYCQRCTTAMKGQENAPAPKNPTPSPVMSSRSDPAAPSAGAAKAATVRVLCPYCKASFNGRVPQKPARGSCPVCQKELILLPNGDIKPAAGFDLGSVQGEAGGAKGGGAAASALPEAPKESNTRLLVKKYAADPAPKMEPPAPVARPAAKRSDPLDTPAPVAASAESESPDESNPLPGWLDDARGSGGGSDDDMVKPQPETDTGLDALPPEAAEADDGPIKLEDPPPPPAPSVRARAPIAAKMPSVAPGRPPAAIEPSPVPEEPEPQVDLLPPDPPKQPAGRLGSGTRRAPLRSGAPQAPSGMTVEAGETTGGRVFAALILALLPIVACGGLLSSRDKLKHELIAKAGARFVKGFGVLHQKMFPPAPAPKPVIEEKKPEPEQPKEEPPKPDPDQQKKDEAAMSTLYTQIIREQRDLKSNLVAASPEQKQQLEQVQRDIEAKKGRLKEKQDLYRKMYGKDYDPAKE
jgi:hypothetical protein